jgi:hypothetical protein
MDSVEVIKGATVDLEKIAIEVNYAIHHTSMYLIITMFHLGRPMVQKIHSMDNMVDVIRCSRLSCWLN